jgi:hypothetical protein
VYILCLLICIYNVLRYVCANVVMASKTIVANLNQGEKLDGKNYDI